jgi:hypothetical protein
MLIAAELDLESAASDMLGPLKDYIPAGVPIWAVLGAAAVLLLLVLLILLAIVRRLFRGKRKLQGGPPDPALFIDLDECPMPADPPGSRRLTVHHQPVRLRFVVLAPMGRDADVDESAVDKLLDLLLPGLGAVARRDQPMVRIWPAQISQSGFTAAFHRHTPKAAQRGEMSRWVLVAGRAQAGRTMLLIGLGLWADQPNTLDRLTLDPSQWLDVLRVRQPG